VTTDPYADTRERRGFYVQKPQDVIQNEETMDMDCSIHGSYSSFINRSGVGR